MNRRYFSGFDGVRAIAAAAVVVHHTELFKQLMKFNSPSESLIIGNLGRTGVDLFFVLSGFLITFILLQEQTSGNESIFKFYLRRARRILPLYFLMIFFAFSQVPEFLASFGGQVGSYVGEQIAIRNDYYIFGLVLNLLMVPNIAGLLMPPIILASHLWSIGVEEQFYLVWPWFTKLKKMKFAIFASLLVVVKTALIYGLLWEYWESNSKQILFWLQFVLTFRIEYMAVGALGAVLVITQEKSLQPILASVKAHYLAPLLFCYTLFFTYDSPIGQIISAFINVIALIALQSGKNVLFENPVSKYIGRISYGTYMFHTFAIILSLAILQDYQAQANFNLILYLLVFGLTYLLSGLSYRFFEQRFSFSSRNGR